MLSKNLIKPKEPMNPHNSNWDKPIPDRLTELENKFLEFEIGVFEILKTMLTEIEKSKIEKEINEDNEDKEDKEETEAPETPKTQIE